MKASRANKAAVAFAFVATVAVAGAVILGDGVRETLMFTLGATWSLSILFAWACWNPEG